MKHQKPLTVESAVRLIDAFLNGATSTIEEENLYAFYKEAPVGSIPSELEAYRPMFAWYSGLKAEDKKPKATFWRRFRYAGVACAVAVIVFGGSLVTKNALMDENPLYAQYDGSYVIRDGKRISDMDLIFNTVIQAERLADSLESVAAREEELLDCDYDRILVETALSNVADPALASELKNELLDEINEIQ